MACLVYQTVKENILSPLKIKQLVVLVLKRTKVSDGDRSAHLVGDQKRKKINARFRGKNQTTDVLSFGIGDGEDLGDIFISIPQIKRQAKQFDISESEEFIRILVHGMLHLLNYDHKKKTEAKEMYSLQEKLVKMIL
jgi:probable rRNA maturation factor